MDIVMMLCAVSSAISLFVIALCAAYVAGRWDK